MVEEEFSSQLRSAEAGYLQGMCYPVGKITEKAVCRSVFMELLLSAKLLKTHSFRLFFWQFCPLDMLQYPCCPLYLFPSAKKCLVWIPFG